MHGSFAERGRRRACFFALLSVLIIVLASCGGSSSNSGSNSSPLPTATLTATPSTFTAGSTASITLAFTSTNATSGTISGQGTVGVNSQIVIPPPSATTTYVYTATGPGGSANASATVKVNPAPQISVSLTASPTPVLAGVPITLTWTSQNATSVVLSNNFGWEQGVISTGTYMPQPPPSATTTYTATATGGFGQTPVTATATVTVSPMTSFQGLTATGDQADGGTTEDDIDPNGAVGTKQFLEYVNTAYQGFDKSTFAPVWSTPQPINTPWLSTSPCGLGSKGQPTIQLDAVVIFDRLASRWVIAGKTTVENDYNFCIAVSNTDDLTSSTFAWYPYFFDISSYLASGSGTTYLPDWPKIGTWWNGYYAAMDMVNVVNNAQTENGALICAFDRTSMLAGTPQTSSMIACEVFQGPSGGGYLSHSLIPADVDGITPPPTGRDEYLVSIQNPPLDGSSTTSNAINLWDCQPPNWSEATPSLSCTDSQLSVQTYTPGCYTAALPAQTDCVPEPGLPAPVGGLKVDSVGDRFMPRFAYRNFGSYESFLISHTVQTGPGLNDCTTNCQDAQQTGIRWYELQGNGSNTPAISQQGTISPDTTNFRFLPSITQDQNGNVVAGYSTSSPASNPGISVSYWNLNDPSGPFTAPTEVSILTSQGEEVPFDPTTGDVLNSGQWGSYASITVDPTDDCTFWYVNEYWPTTIVTGEPASWATNISYFQIPGCQ
jgi:hypothetical protein